MVTQYAKVDAYDGRGEFVILYNDAEKYNKYTVQHRYYDVAACGYGTTKHKKTLAKYGEMKSALLHIAQLFPNE